MLHLISKKITKSISSLEIILFFRQLATLISAGISLILSLEIMRKSQSNVKLQQLLKNIQIDLESGHAFSYSLFKSPHLFDPLTLNLIQAGEHSGTLALSLDRIAFYKERLLLIKRKLKQALFYPLFVMTIAVCMCFVMLTFVIPRFAELFESMHCKLPAFTLFIIQLSIFMRQYYWVGLFLIGLIIILFYYIQRSTTLKIKFERYFLRIPYLGMLYMKVILSRFCRTLATTFAAGVPINDCLHTIAYAQGSNLYGQTIIKLRMQIMKGQQLYQTLERETLFPSLVVEMVRVGEESGTLVKMLEKIASIYEADIDHAVTIAGHLLEPLIMCILGVLIGGLVIAMYLPIFKLGSVI